MLTAGTNLTAAAAGAFEYDGTNLYFTPGAGRQKVCYTDVAQTITGTFTFTADPVLGNTNSLRGTDSVATVRTIITMLGTDVVRFAPLTNAGGFTFTNIAGTVGATFLPNTGVFFFGAATAPAHRIDIGAGTTAIAPIRIAAGTNLTTAVAGCFEYDGTDLFFTPTGTTRQKFAYRDLAQTWTANQTWADAVNWILGTTTGTKIGTATSQKIGLWNAAPIVQPTTAVAAATFVANTSGIVNDTATWDGYTVGQVVKALRNMGVLA
jgi:hypothetical protein